MEKNIVPSREQVAQEDKWDLTQLYKTDADWEADLALLAKQADILVSFQGKLASSKEQLLESLAVYEKMELVGEKVGNYAFLLTAGDSANDDNQAKHQRFMMQYGDAQAKMSFFVPEIQTIPQETIEEWLAEPAFKNYEIWLKKLLRLRPHILSEKEERIFALHLTADETAHKAFSLLTNVDLDYGSVKTADGEVPITQSSWSVFMESQDRQVRKDAYNQFYSAFDKHKNTIATLYSGSVMLDVCNARARGYSSSRQAALFGDDVAESVYDNLISTVRANLEPLHRYYALRKRILGLGEKGQDLRHYDVYVPLVKDVEKVTPYNDAVELLRASLAPLGKEYTDTLCTGLVDGWVDKFENKGKRSGAFSSGGYTGYPYIMMNYKENVLRDVFTLAHEGGHSMHSWYSAKSNPPMHYSYTIFEAEVASTFNEELLFNYLLKNEKDANVRKYLLVNRASDILATLYRQTMFAEYEKITHELAEKGEPLTVEKLRSVYRELLEAYFGPEMVFEEMSDLEGLRIPHFYRAFYVYKYATGISASLALADRVLNGGEKEKEEYFSFLKSGGSRYPIESLKLAGVDMSKAAPIEAAIARFSDLITELEREL